MVYHYLKTEMQMSSGLSACLGLPNKLAPLLVWLVSPCHYKNQSPGLGKVHGLAGNACSMVKRLVRRV